MTYELIADSGSTKTDWALLREGRVAATAHTAGLNPFQMTGEEMEAELRAALLPALQAAIGPLAPHALSVRFYGAGCTPEKRPVVERALRAVLPVTGGCEVDSDMLGAARAVCGDRPGICCILGTGSNSCAYDGRRIVKNVPPLGFILGDEGSGAVMGRTLVADVLKGLMPQAVRDRFFDKYGLTQADVIERVYRQPRANAFLASFVPFIAENIGEPAVGALVRDAFRAFLSRNVMRYDGWRELPVGFVGSVAFVFRRQLAEAMAEAGMTLGRIVRRPLDALCG